MIRTRVHPEDISLLERMRLVENAQALIRPTLMELEIPRGARIAMYDALPT